MDVGSLSARHARLIWTLKDLSRAAWPIRSSRFQITPVDGKPLSPPVVHGVRRDQYNLKYYFGTGCASWSGALFLMLEHEGTRAGDSRVWRAFLIFRRRTEARCIAGVSDFNRRIVRSARRCHPVLNGGLRTRC
jgi:hypothetical protein